MTLYLLVGLKLDLLSAQGKRGDHVASYQLGISSY